MGPDQVLHECGGCDQERILKNRLLKTTSCVPYVRRAHLILMWGSPCVRDYSAYIKKCIRSGSARAGSANRVEDATVARTEKWSDVRSGESRVEQKVFGEIVRRIVLDAADSCFRPSRCEEYKPRRSRRRTAWLMTTSW